MMQRLTSLLLLLFLAWNGAQAQTSTCGTPSNVAVSNITVTSAKATWDAVQGALYYRVQATKLGTTLSKFYSTSQTNSTMSYLDPSTSYSFTVTAVCSGNTLSVPSTAMTFTTTANTSCGTPTNVVVSNITGNSAKFTWSAVSGAQSYRVMVTNLSNNTTSTYSTSSTIYTSNFLNANTNYSFTVAAWCNNLPGTASAAQTFSTPSVSCGVPSNPAVSNVTYNSARFQWTALAGANQYRVEYKLNTAANFTTITTSSTMYNFYNLVASSDYSVRVSAVCSGVVGAATANVNFTTLAAPACNAPASITVNSVSYNTANISWAAVQGANSYRIAVLKAGSTTPLNYGSSLPTLNLYNLLPNTVYTFTVSSYCGGITGTPSASMSFTTTSAPSCSAPTDLSMSNVTAFTATATWTAVPGATTYRITRTTTNSTVTYGTGSSPTLNITNLTANTTYTFTISSVCGQVVGAPSAPVTITTLAAPACNPPSNVTVANIDVQKATISWTPIAGVTLYRIKLQAAGATTAMNYSSSTSSLSLTTLQPGTTYTYEVAATCGSYSNVSAYSAPQTFTTLQAGACNAPTNVTVSNITSFTAKVAWDSVTGVTNWRVQVVQSGSTSNTYYTSYKASYIIANLNPATAYTVNVTAVCPVNILSNPGTATFTTATAVLCTDLNEPNNSTAAATPLTVGAVTSGSLEVAGDLDYFSFSNTATEPNMKITLTNLPKDYDLRIYNSAGIVVGSSMKVQTNDEVVKLANMPVGTYYAQVFGFASAFTPYACYSIKAEIANVPFTLGSNGGTDFSNNDNATTELRFNVFPNPAQSQATVRFDENVRGDVYVRVSDITGRIVKSYQWSVSASNPMFEVDLSNIENGIYFLNVQQDKTQKTTKLVVNH